MPKPTPRISTTCRQMDTNMVKPKRSLAMEVASVVTAVTIGFRIQKRCMLCRQFLLNTIHQLTGDIEIECFTQFPDAGGAGYIDLGKVITDDIYPDKE